jgi:hypothetical protein
MIALAFVAQFIPIYCYLRNFLINKNEENEKIPQNSDKIQEFDPVLRLRT